MRKLSLLLLIGLIGFTGCNHLYDVVQEPTGEVVQETYTDKDGNVIKAGTPIFEEVHVPKPWVLRTVEGSQAIPVPFVDVAAYLAMGVLSIGGIWLDSRRRKSEKVSQSLVKGIDTFRDILALTEGGDKIDKRLTEVLKEHQSELQVLNEVNRLLQKYATPEKKRIES